MRALRMLGRLRVRGAAPAGVGACGAAKAKGRATAGPRRAPAARAGATPQTQTQTLPPVVSTVAAAPAPAKARASTAGPSATPPPAAVYGALWAGYVIPFAMMTFLPFLSATRWIARSYWALLPLGAIYLYLMPLAWEPGTLQLLLPGSLEVGLDALRKGEWNPQFIPNLDGIMYVFTKNSVSVAALLAHLLAGNLFAGRYVFSHARKRRVPAAHSIALCSVFSLVGLASHVVTCVLWRMTARLRGGDADGAFVTYRF